MVKSCEIRLKSYPVGMLDHDSFEIVTVEVPSPAENEVLIKNLWMSIDAGQRTLMEPLPTDLPDLPVKRFRLGDVLEGQAIGQVVESRNPSLPVGTIVTTNHGWREFFTFAGAPDGFTLRVLENPADPLQSHLHINSIYGATAYFHVTDGAKVKAGETVWISTAAGTTGSIAAQIASISGCRVIGTTSSDEKVAWLKENLQIDAALNYRAEDFREQLRTACPDGIDVFIDFAGGEQLEIAIDFLNPRGRIVKVGDTATYDGSSPVGPRNMFEIILKRLDMLGRSIFDYLTQPSQMATAYARIAKWVAEGRIKVAETVYEGIEMAPQAQIDLFKGKNIGKMLVRLGEREAL